MTSFEFFTVLLSFVISIGVASLLQSVIRLLQEHDRVRFSLSWALWAGVIFFAQIIFWLRAWSYSEGFTLRVETSLPPLILAIIAFIACGLATPRIPADGPIDLKAFHMSQGRKYQLAYAAYMIVAIVQTALMLSQPLSDIGFQADAATQLAMALASIARAMFLRATWVQVTIPALLLLSIIPYYGRLMDG
jgi:hypothetical protein